MCARVCVCDEGVCSDRMCMKTLLHGLLSHRLIGGVSLIVSDASSEMNSRFVGVKRNKITAHTSMQLCSAISFHVISFCNITECQGSSNKLNLHGQISFLL